MIKMPIIPKVPTPEFGSEDFNSIQGVTITGAFAKVFARLPATTLSKLECEQIFNNQEASITL